MEASSTGWNFRHYLWMKRGQKRSGKTRDELAMTAVQAAPERHHHGIRAGAAPSRRRRAAVNPNHCCCGASDRGKSPPTALSWRKRQGKQAQSAFKIMKALTSGPCSSWERFCQGGSSAGAARRIAVSQPASHWKQARMRAGENGQLEDCQMHPGWGRELLKNRCHRRKILHINLHLYSPLLRMAVPHRLPSCLDKYEVKRFTWRLMTEFIPS